MKITCRAAKAAASKRARSVSYTHLDVYKRQDSLDAMHWLAIAEHRSGEDDFARLRVREILKRNPRFLPAIDDEMQFAVDRRDFRTAVSAQLTRVAVMRDPPASEYCRLGLIWLSMSNLAEAESAPVSYTHLDVYKRQPGH